LFSHSTHIDGSSTIWFAADLSGAQSTMEAAAFQPIDATRRLLDSCQRLASRLQTDFARHRRARLLPVAAVDNHQDDVRLLERDDLAAAKRDARGHIDGDFDELAAYAHDVERETGFS
jgi:hypothetical protein